MSCDCGPGTVHVRHWRAGGTRGQPPATYGTPDPPINIPRHLPQDWRAEICAEGCAQTLVPREGKELRFRPGQRLDGPARE